MSPSRIVSAAIVAGATLAPPASIAANPAPPTVMIVLASHYFQPNPIYLAGGVPVHLVLENRSGKTHDFTAPEFFRSARMISGAAPDGRVTLLKGRGMELDLVPRRGTYKLHCSQPLHTMLGMTGKIVVS